MKGAWGEDAACGYLEGLGYRIVERNFRTRFGEIDIIAERGAYIVFAEVKSRKNARFAEAREFVTEAKQRKILTTAELWLSGHRTELQPRFDVIEVYGEENSPVKPCIKLFENAFGES